MKESLTRLSYINSSGVNIYIPSHLVKDSSFPFKSCKKRLDVIVRISGNRLIVEPIEFVSADKL